MIVCLRWNEAYFSCYWVFHLSPLTCIC